MVYKIFKIRQDVNNDYDNEDEARKIHPDGTYDYKEHEKPNLYAKGEYDKCDRDYGTWSRKIYVGEAKEGSVKGVVCSSFRAG
jgi:hypothetical protein